MKNVTWYKGNGFKDWISKNFDFEGWYVPVLALILTLIVGYPLVLFIIVVITSPR